MFDTLQKYQIGMSALLLLCLADLPYGFYVLVRFVAAIAFLLFAYAYYQRQQKALTITFAVLALLFQPFFKVTLGRAVWTVVDVAVAIFLLLLVFKSKRRA